MKRIPQIFFFCLLLLHLFREHTTWLTASGGGGDGMSVCLPCFYYLFSSSSSSSFYLMSVAIKWPQTKCGRCFACVWLRKRKLSIYNRFECGFERCFFFFIYLLFLSRLSFFGAQTVRNFRFNIQVFCLLSGLASVALLVVHPEIDFVV